MEALRVIAEMSKFQSTIKSPGQYFCIFNLRLARLFTTEFAKLDVLGLENDDGEITEPIYDRSLEQLSRSSEGWYITGLPWKSGEDNRQSNKKRSINHLQNIPQKFTNYQELFTQCHNIIQE